MALKIYNTLTRKKEIFTPIEAGKVRMYVCGITAYDHCHLGHARGAVNFDVVYRYLKSIGYDVTFAKNYTDVDDKIIKKANETGCNCKDVSEKYIKQYVEDMKTLGNLPPTVEPKATEHIPEMIAVIKKLIEKGYAYVEGGDVFYSVRKFKGYGKLSGKKIEELESGARVEVDERKHDPLDFALWKASKPGEPEWDSPWGKGRPGWHIECSTMSAKYLGETFDIHGGGRDLVFPHHENEIAQAEGATGKPFVKYWLHNGFVNINAEKMSKSLKNFCTIGELLTRYHPEVIRYFLLSAHYRSPLDYTEKNVGEAGLALTRYYEGVKRFKDFQRGEGAGALDKKIAGLEKDFLSAMDDDFNTAGALGIVFDGLRAMNKHLDKIEKSNTALAKKDAEDFQNFLNKICNVLGLFGSDPVEFLERKKTDGLDKRGLSPADIEAKIKERAAARAAKNWKRSDAIRDELASKGIKIKDNPGGSTSWSV